MNFHNSGWKGALQALALYTCVKKDTQQNGVKTLFTQAAPSSLKGKRSLLF
jgi:hypothetical protein